MTAVARESLLGAGGNGEEQARKPLGLPRSRVAALDAFRGLAVLFMLVDHVALLTAAPDGLRLLPGRLAMPMFFLLAGYLASAPRWRHLWIVVAGCALPLAVPWIDSPNVLVLWGLGVAVLYGLRRLGAPAWPVAALGLTIAANGWAVSDGSYDLWALLGLMALGSMLPVSPFSWAGRLPGWRLLAAVGRHAVGWYLGHLLILQAGVLLVVAS